MMKRGLATFLTGIMTVTLVAAGLTGCGSSTAGKRSEKVRLMVWSPSEDQSKDSGEWLQTMCNTFAKEHPSMKYMERRGSGLRKIVSETEKLPGYTEAYKPEFSSTATDFRVILKNVNYHLSQKDLVNDQDCDQVSDQDKSQDILHAVLDFCITEKSKQEICSFIGYRNLTYFTRKYLNPLLASGQLKMTIPDKPNSRKQKYITVRSE